MLISLFERKSRRRLMCPEAESLWSGPERSAWWGSQGGEAPLATLGLQYFSLNISIDKRLEVKFFTNSYKNCHKNILNNFKNKQLTFYVINLKG